MAIHLVPVTAESLHEHVFGVTIPHMMSELSTVRDVAPGDVLRARTPSADGAVDLGERHHVVEGADA